MPDTDDSKVQDIVIRAIDVKRYYGSGEAVTKALDGVTLDVYRGEYLSIMGPSGSGKSTLFNMIGGIDSPTEGMVFIDEIDVAQLDSYELAWMRCHKIGYIFQSYNILPVLTALENITLPMVFAGLSADDARDKGADILKLVGLGERIFHRPYEMSGGDRRGYPQRPGHHPGRRADRQPRRQHRQGNHRPAAGVEGDPGRHDHLRNARHEDAGRL